MWTNRSSTEEINVISDVVCLSNDGNPTSPTQVDGSDTVAAGEARGTPKKGMTFDSLEALEKLYLSYGKACGFGVIRVGAKKDGNTNVKWWNCWISEQGWFVGTLKVELTHKNHVPTPSKSWFIPSYWDVPKFVLRVEKDLMDAGVKQSQIYHALANQMNGFENLPFLLKDMHNVVGKERSKELDETDCRTMFEYFAKMKEENEDFFFSWRVDEANKLMDVVWVDARSRVAYMNFCDVVCFDATYITNHYELPFANFVGVNHHGQTILLGCTLVRNEDTKTYKWVMQEWLECMGGVQPGGIITDKSVPMAKAIQKVLPHIRHRFCVWHILSKVSRKLLAVKKVGEVHKKMKDVVYDSLFIEEFESRWIELIRSFKLEGNENVNHSREVLPKKYTDAKFKEVQTECLALIYVLPGTEVQLSKIVTEYTLIDRIQVGDPIRHVTRGLKDTVDMEKLEFNYSCRMFEHKGILCHHCIQAMEMTNIPTVLEKYVLNRLRKDVKRKHLDVKVAFHAPDKTEDEIRYGRLNMSTRKYSISHPHQMNYANMQLKMQKPSLKSWSSSDLERGLKVAKMILSLAHKVHPQLNGFTEHVDSCYSNSTPFGHDYRGTLATASSTPFTPPLSQFGSRSSTMHGVSTASNGQPIRLPQSLPQAVTSFLPPRPS
ncbi:Protein FAR-RED IMPAIRED RESPONSE 1 [Bienertia sinuspersici]